jgi:hypothetical protein
MSQQFDCWLSLHANPLKPTYGVAIPNALVINASNIVTKITGEFGGAAIGAAINFTAISLGENSLLAQVTANGYKKGIFF